MSRRKKTNRAHRRRTRVRRRQSRRKLKLRGTRQVHRPPKRPSRRRAVRKRHPAANAGPEGSSVQAAAAAALSIFKLSPPEPEIAILAKRCGKVLAALLPSFPEVAAVGTGVGFSTFVETPPAPGVGSAVEAKDDPFAGEDPFATGAPGAPPAVDALTPAEPVSLVIAWEDDPAREELARFEDGTLLVNRLHPAFLRARDAGALDSYLGLSLGWAIAGNVAPESARHFIGQFLLRWADDT